MSWFPPTEQKGGRKPTYLTSVLYINVSFFSFFSLSNDDRIFGGPRDPRQEGRRPHRRRRRLRRST